jgi:protein-tyrosine-phosphatase
MPRLDVAQRAAIHAALADAHRLAIVDDLMVSDRSPSELRTRLRMESNLMAHHLDALERVGLIERFVSDGDRRRRYVRLVRGPLEGLVHPPTIPAARVLFVCTRNSARSQLAAAMWNARAAVSATSAGTTPAQRVHPGALRSARRRGLTLRHPRPRLFEPAGHQTDLVITVCDRAHEDLAARDLDIRMLHWSVDDPAEVGSPQAFDQAAETLAARVEVVAPLVAPAPRRRSS